MKPTIGRIVYLRLIRSTEPVPMLVTEVHGPSCISGQYFNRDGGGFASSVMLDSGVNDPSEPFAVAMGWDWMPYQKEQAELKL